MNEPVDFFPDLLSYGKEYLDLLQESPRHPEVIIGAFERALNSLHRMPRIWLDYLDFLCKQQKYRAMRPVLIEPFKLFLSHNILVYGTLFSQNLLNGLVWSCPFCQKSLWERYLQVAPEKRTDYIKYLKRIEDWDTAALELVTLANSLMKSTNDLTFKDEKKPQRRPKEEEERIDTFDESDESDSEDIEVDFTVQKCWDSLCQLVIEHSHEIKSISVDSILRTAISVFQKDQGRYWTALATFHIRRGYFDTARLVFEEAMSKVFLVRDFAQIYDSYAKMEETILEISIEDAVKVKKGKKNKSGKKGFRTWGGCFKGYSHPNG